MKKIICLILIFLFLFSSLNVESLNILIDASQENSLNKIIYDEKYAVIIVGKYGAKNQEKISGNPIEKYYQWYTGDAQNFFNILVDIYNFKRENIFILLTEINRDGFTPGSNFDPNSFHSKNYMNSTKDNITKVFNILRNKINDNDNHNELLLVELIGHGKDKSTIKIPILNKYIDLCSGINAYDTCFPLWNPDILTEDSSKKVMRNIFPIFFRNKKTYSNSTDSKYSLSEKELAEMTTSILSTRTIYFLQPCHSGGFINSLSSNTSIIFTAGEEGIPIGNFLGPLYDGLGKKGFDYQDENGNFVDANKDGNLSLIETYNWTIKHIRNNDPCDPMIDDNGDLVGHHDFSLIDGYDGYITSKVINLSYELI